MISNLKATIPEEDGENGTWTDWCAIPVGVSGASLTEEKIMK